MNMSNIMFGSLGQVVAFLSDEKKYIYDYRRDKKRFLFGIMLVQRHIWWSSITSALGQCIVLSG